LSEDNFGAGKYTEVLCLVGVALESGPNSASLHSMAGACHYQLKDGPRAVAEVQQAIYLDPGNEDYYLQLAQVFIDYNTADAAILLLEPTLERFPASARMRYVLGVACLRSSKYVEAERYLTESLRLDPKNPLALRALAMLYEGESQWAALLKLSESMLDLPDIRAEGYYYQANADFNLLRGQPDRFPEIEKLLESSTSLNPNFFPVYLFGAESSSRGVLTLRPSKSSPGPLSSTPSHPPPTTTWRLLTGRSAKPRKALKPSTGSKCLVRRRRISPRSRDSYTN
jgi:tetratricopeptide (TPR) repeat protein